MKDFQDIERVFNREKRPFWALHDAKGKRRSCTPNSIMKMANHEERLKESFTFLETVLEDEGDGVYKLFLRTSENAGKGQIEQVFQYGDEVEPVVTQSKGSDRAREPKVAGLGALGSIGGLEFITGLMNNGRNEADRLREEKHSLQLELLEKKFQIGNLEAQVNAPPATDNSWTDLIKGIFQDHSELIIEKVFPETEGRTKIASLKSKRPIEVPKKAKTTKVQRDGAASAEKTGNTEGSSSGQSGQNAKARFTAVLENMSNYFPDENPIEVLERLEPIFEDLVDLFPKDNPLDVIEVVLELARSKMGKSMVLPIIEKKLAKRAADLEAEDDQDQDQDEDDDDEEGDDDDE